MKLHFTAAEPSGDLLARETIEAVLARVQEARIVGIGGSEMARIGLESPFDISPLSVLGYFEAIRAYPDVLKLADAAADHIIASAPDAAILVDSWGFTIRVAQRVKKRAPHVRLVKLVGPQVWATRPGRAKTIAASFDQVLCLHEMERPFYEALDIKVDVIGNPALSRAHSGDGPGFRNRYGLNRHAPVLLVLPGSRRNEIDKVAPTLMDTALRLKARRPELQLVAAPADGVARQFRERFAGRLDEVALAGDSSERFDAMAAANLALACSGTVTSELAVQGTPMLVGYRLGTATYLLARNLLYRHAHITLLNIAAGDIEIVPEFVQGDFTAGAMAERAARLLDDPSARTAQIAAQNRALKAMGQGARPAPELAAEAILDGVRAKTS